MKLFKKEQPGKNEPSQPADLAAACHGGNFLASSAGEAYDVRARSPNREFRLNSAGKGKNHAANNRDHSVSAFPFGCVA